MEDKLRPEVGGSEDWVVDSCRLDERLGRAVLPGRQVEGCPEVGDRRELLFVISPF